MPDFKALNEFLFVNFRLPRITDEIKPWHYEGWLLPYIQIIPLESDIEAVQRWHWYFDLRSQATYRGDDKIKIPKIHFSSTPNSEAMKQITKAVELLEYKEGSWTGLRLFVDWLAYALAVEKEAPKITEQMNEALYKQFNLEWLLKVPHDYLGAVIAERRGGGWNPHAFFPTPHAVVEMITLMTCLNCRPGDTVNDPALGSARMLLCASNYSLRLYGNDIDGLMVKVAKINGALYAPWLSFPFPDSFWAAYDQKNATAPLIHAKPRVIELIPEHVNSKGQGLLF